MADDVAGRNDGTAGDIDIASLKPDLKYRDLREWMAEAEKLDEVRHVKGLSWEDS